MSAPVVLIMAGGTGGHVFPALAVAERLQAHGAEVHWLGTRAGIEADIVPAAGIAISYIRIAGLRGKGLLRKLVTPFRMAWAVVEALAVMHRVRPGSVLGMGGYASGPGGIAAWLSRRPLVLHEQNSVAGMTNRMLARLTSHVFEAFPGSFGEADVARAVGNPVRSSLMQLPAPEQRIMHHGERARVLVLGGSLGAVVINESLPQALAQLHADERPEVWHQAGRRNLEQARAAYANQGVEARVVPFIEDMREAYGWADLVLCRAGAMTVTELTMAGVGSVLVPLPHAVDDHQTGNARYLVQAGAGILLPQAEMNAESLSLLLRELCGDREKLRAMAVAARQLAQPGAADAVADCCLELSHG